MSKRAQLRRTSRGRRGERGQAISEYAMIIAFVAILVALVFAFAPEKLGTAVSAAYQAVADQLNNLSSAADTYN